MRFLNFGYTEEGAMMYNYGVEGVSYTMVDGKPQWTEAMLDGSEGPWVTIREKYKKHTAVELDGDKPDKKFIQDVVRMLALEDKLNNMPNNLSGGQQQRVAIARALITKPAIVLADEPTGNLDSKTSADVLGLLKRTSYEFHQTLVMITHNNDIARLADRIVRIEDGKIVG